MTTEFNKRAEQFIGNIAIVPVKKNSMAFKRLVTRYGKYMLNADFIRAMHYDPDEFLTENQETSVSLEDG